MLYFYCLAAHQVSVISCMLFVIAGNANKYIDIDNNLALSQYLLTEVIIAIMID